MAQTDGSLTQANDNYSVNYLAKTDWSMLHLQPMSFLLNTFKWLVIFTIAVAVSCKYAICAVLCLILAAAYCRMYWQ